MSDAELAIGAALLLIIVIGSALLCGAGFPVGVPVP